MTAMIAHSKVQFAHSLLFTFKWKKPLNRQLGIDADEKHFYSCARTHDNNMLIAVSIVDVSRLAMVSMTMQPMSVPQTKSSTFHGKLTTLTCNWKGAAGAGAFSSEYPLLIRRHHPKSAGNSFRARVHRALACRAVWSRQANELLRRVEPRYREHRDRHLSQVLSPGASLRSHSSDADPRVAPR